MTTTLHVIERASPVNLRDLGGIRIAGGTLRAGMAIRADDLSIIPDADAEGLVTAGLTTIIDLRSAEEVALTGRGVLAGYPVAYHHVPLLASIGAGMPTGDRPAFDHRSMGEMYVAMTEASAAHLATILGIIALAPGTVAFHCAAGRDRTGVVAGMLLLALGASDDEIVADYARTGRNMPAIHLRMRPIMGALLADLGFDLDEMTSLTDADEPMDISMRLLLARLRERHGDALAPLRDAGLNRQTIVRLQRRALQGR